MLIMSHENKLNDKITLKILDILKQPRTWILFLFLIFSFFAINYSFSDSGVSINGITPGSIAEKAGISYNSKASLTNLEKITHINGQEIKSETQYYSIISNLENNTQITIATNENPSGYSLLYINNQNLSASEVLGISVREPAKTNIKLGIELEGGSRIILKALNNNLSEDEYNLLTQTLQNRLDIYGASGTKVNKLEDAFSNDKFIIIESISSNKNDIYELIQKQGEFTAKFNNISIFTGENILRVFNDPSHVQFNGCSENINGFICGYAFTVEIDSESTQRFYDEARKTQVIGDHLSEKIFFILDGEEITSLSVASSFKYQKISNPQISISGNELPTKELALESAQKEMQYLQAILSTKSLPSELEIVQSYSITSSRGETLLSNAIYVGILALLLVAAIVALRYKHIGIFIGILIALLGEVIIVLGIAAFMRISIDLAAIGGLIAAIGTGVDDQIIITDEYFRKKNSNLASRKRIKNAMYIVMIAYFTTMAAMIPLYFAGLKVLQGFAFMIIIGITVGVFITRPAYAAMLRIILTKKEERIEEDKEDK